jgi:hypothetical protein
VLACLVVLLIGESRPAYAYTFQTLPDVFKDPATGEICPGPGLTRRIMPCIKETLLAVVNAMLIPISDYIAETVTVCCALATGLWGTLMIGGRNSAPIRDAIMLVIKMAGVVMFSYNFGDCFGLILDIMEDLMTMVTGYLLTVTPFGGTIMDLGSGTMCPNNGGSEVLMVWDAVDCTLNALVGGIFSPLTLTMGLIGFLIACLFSNSIGFTIGLLGIYLILQLTWAVVRSLYIFLSAYIGVCFMVIISPFFIPTILFRATKGYFAKWLRIFMSFIIQPLFLFTYLAMLLAAFNLVVFTGKNSLYVAIIGDDAMQPDFGLPMDEGGQGGIGGWLFTHGAYANDVVNPVAVAVNTGDYNVQERINQVNDDVMPNAATDTGLSGIMAQRDGRLIAPQMVLASVRNRQASMISRLGTGGGEPCLTPIMPPCPGTPGTNFEDTNGNGVWDGAQPLRFFQFDIPTTTIDWSTLATENGYPATAEGRADYLFRILLAAIMSLIVGYIFIELLDTIPFVGSGIAMGSGMVDEKSLGMSSLGMGKMAPPGNDVIKAQKLNWHSRGG